MAVITSSIVVSHERSIIIGWSFFCYDGAMNETLDLAILYWFYQDPEVTRNHLELIRRYNPNAKIYGLFGGKLVDAKSYEETLGGLLDDFWVYPGTYGADSNTKWMYGNLLLVDWYDKRGRNLKWDSIAILQWDMLLFADIRDIVPGLKKDQVFFSGYRELNDVTENRWYWTKPGGEDRKDYLAFKRYVAKKYGYTSRPKSCLYILEVLTSNFFDMYLELDDKKIGMLEYKDPTLAFIWGISIYQHDVGVYWIDKGQSLEESPMNASAIKIKPSFIENELVKPDGWRLFHPYESNYLF